MDLSFCNFVNTSNLPPSPYIGTLKGLGYIVQMRDSGAKAVTSMLDVQLKII